MSQPKTLALDSPAMQTLTLGTLTRLIPRVQVDAALTRYQRHNKYTCKLPALLLVYYVIALGLQMREPTREVLYWVLDGLRRLWGKQTVPAKTAGKAAISMARERLGWEVLREVFVTCVRPLAVRRTRGAWYRGYRLMAIDGTVLATPDTPSNLAAFGKSGSKGGPSAYPLLRLVGLIEIGTHAIVAAALGAWGESEVALAAPLLSGLQRGMLLLADRLSFSRARWFEASASRAALLWRVSWGVRLPCEEVLADGSYLSTLYRTAGDRRRGTGGQRVRVIEYALPGVPDAEPRYRLLTTLLDPAQAPAVELAALYHERWEGEGVLDEVKTHLRGGDQVLLRSLTADRIRQEVYGLLLAHYTGRAVMHDAALQAEEDPDRLSFMHTVRVLRRALPQAAALPPSAVVALVS